MFGRGRYDRLQCSIQNAIPDFPDIPTIGELGHKDLGALSLDYWLMAPPQTPKARLQVLEEALMKTLKDPEFLAWAKGANVEPGSDERRRNGQDGSKPLHPFRTVQGRHGEIHNQVNRCILSSRTFLKGSIRIIYGKES